MKFTKTVTRAACDLCGNDETCFLVCQGCGIDICYTCEKSVCLLFKRDIYCSTVFAYCPSCSKSDDIRLTPLFKAFQAIGALKLERENFYKDFEKRAAQAAHILDSLLESEEKG